MKIEELRTKRTGLKFDEYFVTHNKTKDAYIIKFSKPNTSCGSVTFINAEGILAVTGDYGNWIFCREFHPSHDGYVSDMYWLEKLRIASSQKPCNFSEEKTRKEIEELLNDEDCDKEEKEYLEDILSHVDDGEERYLVYAHDNLPPNRDHEFVPHGKELNPWLECIFDVFDEVCRRMPKDKD